MTDRASTPTLGDLLDQTSRRTNESQRGPIPGRIIIYDRTTQRADVQPLVWPQGNELPIVRDVPIAWPRSSAGSLTFDLSAGDFVELVPQEVDVSSWTVREITGAAPTKRRFNLADYIAIPGLGTLVSKLPASAFASGAVVLAGSDIRLGGSTASDFVALASLVLSELQSIKSDYDTHTHPTPAGPSSPPTIPLTPPGSVASSNTRSL